jgi:archaellum component FlaC
MDPKIDQSVLIQKIKKWLEYESKISNLQKEIKELKKNRIVVSNDLKTIMKNKELDCIDVNNGKILYTTTEVKKGINKLKLDIEVNMDEFVFYDDSKLFQLFNNYREWFPLCSQLKFHSRLETLPLILREIL